MKNWNEIIKKLSMLGWFQEYLSTLDVNVLQRKIFFFLKEPQLYKNWKKSAIS